MRKHLLCTLMNASTLISGIAFAASTDPDGMLSVDPVDPNEDPVATMLTVPGFKIHELGGETKAERAAREKQEREDAERDEANARLERETREREAAEQAEREKQEAADRDAAAERERVAAAEKAEQDEKDAAAAKEADEMAQLEREVAAEEAAKAADTPPADTTTAAPAKSDGKSKGSK